MTFQEHEKRCWSVDFNQVNTKLLASGSDDTKVKLWSTDIQHSVASLEAKANVCCVKFNPSSCYHLAFGSADHCVHYYDLRYTKQPLNIFKGHKKAVSYVKFLNKVIFLMIRFSLLRKGSPHWRLQYFVLVYFLEQ